jgi:LPXTG-site transpeptidase (sortase) family protein
MPRLTNRNRYILLASVAFVAMAYAYSLSLHSADPTDAHSRARWNVPEAVADTGFVPGAPVSIMIPHIGVQARVVQVSRDRDGAIGVPQNPNDVGWFDRSVKPGMNGAAILVGHSGWIGQTPVAFDDVHELRPGDKIYVTDESGAVIAFMVRETELYDRTAPFPDISDLNSSANLILITCAGDWNYMEQEYAKRFVVFADRV